MSVPEHLTSEQKQQLRIEALNKELSRVRETSRLQSIKINHLRLWFYFTLVFSSTLFIFLIIQGFISIPGQAVVTNTTTIIDTIYIEQKINQDSLKNISYNIHPAAIRKPDYQGILFAIQIGAYKDLDLSQYKDNMLGLKQDTYDTINQFTLGEFIEYEEAQNFLKIMQQMGFEQAHLIAYKDGYRIRLESALAMQNIRIPSNEEADKGFIEANDDRFDLLAK